MPLHPSGRENPEGDCKVAIIKSAIEALNSEPRSQPPTCSELYARVSEHFEDEERFVFFACVNWAKVPEVIPILDNGPGWYSAHTGFKYAGIAEPIEHVITSMESIPPQENVFRKLIGFTGPISSVVLFTSRTAARAFQIELQMHILAERTVEGLSDMGGPGPFAVERGPADASSRPPWWHMIIIATSLDPTPAEQTFFKYCAARAGPIPVMVFGSGDVTGLKAAKKVIETSRNGPCVCHAHWVGAFLSNEIKKLKAIEAIAHLLPPGTIPDTAGIRRIADEIDEVKAQLDELCNLRDVPESDAASSDMGRVEAAVVSGIGRSARELREAGIFIPLAACSKNILAYQT